MMAKPATLFTIGITLLFLGIAMVWIAVYKFWGEWFPTYMARPTVEYYDETVEDDVMMQVR